LLAIFGSVRFIGLVVFASFDSFKLGTTGSSPLKRPFPRFALTVGITPEKKAFYCPKEETTPEKLPLFCSLVLSAETVNPRTNITIEITAKLLKYIVH
jgi:hypothetical protein